MNKIKYFLILLITIITFASCSTTYASAQSPYEYDDTYTTSSVTFSTVVRYGTPYYIDNVLSYYLYRGIYYYPYRYNNYWYFYPSHYCRPRGFVYHYQPGYRHFMRPAPRGYEFRKPPMRPGRPNDFRNPPMKPNRPPINYGKPTNRPSFGNGQRPNKPNNMQRPPMNNKPNINQRPNFGNQNRRPQGFGSDRSSTRVTQGRPCKFNSGGHFGGRR